MVAKYENEFETKCHECDENYDDNSALKVHLEKNHGQSFEEKKEKIFLCEKCGKLFARLRSLNKHDNRGEYNVENLKLIRRCHKS